MVGTIFFDSKVSLHKWFKTLQYFLIKSGVSSVDVAVQIGTQQKTAWMMLTKIRKALVKHFRNKVLTGIIEMDETWIGPDTTKDLRITAAITKFKQKIVFAMRQREVKETYEEMKAAGRKKRKVLVPAQVIPFIIGNCRENINLKSIILLIMKHIHPDAHVVTDGHSVYDRMDVIFDKHEVVVHSYKIPVLDENEEPVLKDDGKPKMINRQKFVDYITELDGKKRRIHTNGVENNWKHLKRLSRGAYIRFSYAHAQGYVFEHAFRFNIRSLNPVEQFNELLMLCCQTQVSCYELKQHKRFRAFYTRPNGKIKYVPRQLSIKDYEWCLERERNKYFS